MSNRKGRSSTQKSKLKEQLIRRDGRDCHYCGHTTRKGGSLDGSLMTLEHIVPVSEGGTWSIKNLVIACYDCNRKRGSKASGCDCDTCSSARFFHQFAFTF